MVMVIFMPMVMVKSKGNAILMQKVLINGNGNAYANVYGKK